MELFKPFVDFFRTLSIMYDMECLDLGDHTTKWMVKVVVMPSVLLLGASLHYMYMVHKKMPTAFMQLKSTFFFIVFFPSFFILFPISPSHPGPSSFRYRTTSAS